MTSYRAECKCGATFTGGDFCFTEYGKWLDLHLHTCGPRELITDSEPTNIDQTGSKSVESKDSPDANQEEVEG